MSRTRAWSAQIGRDIQAEQPVELPFVVTLPMELTNGNDGRGKKWFSSSKARKQIEQLLRQLNLVRDPFNVVVSIHITRILGKGQRFWDADSILRGNSKELIDACVACGWFSDDSMKYVSEVTAGQDASQRANGPAVGIEIKSAE